MANQFTQVFNGLHHAATRILSAPLGILTLAALTVGAAPAWSLARVFQPDPATMERAYVVDVINFNTLIVSIDGELGLQVVQMLGVEALPTINPAWTSITGEVPMAVYEAGQYLATRLDGDFIYLETDPLYVQSPGVIGAYVWHHEQLVNQDILFRGHALLNDDDAEMLKYGPVLTEATDVAQVQGHGVWTFYGPKPARLRQEQDQAEETTEPVETIVAAQ